MGQDELELEPGPDGDGWWPTAFAVDRNWADRQTSSWRPVVEHPTLQARRSGDILDITDGTTTNSYQLASAADLSAAYIATKG